MHNDRSTSITLRLLVGLVALLLAAGPIVVLGALTTRIDDSERGQDEVESVVKTMAEESAAVADWYFAAPEAGLEVLVSQLTARVDDSLLRPEVRRLLFDVLISHQNLDSVYAARSDGSFVFVAHDDTTDASYRIKEIAVDDRGGRTVTLSWTNDAFEVITTEVDDGDDYDPRSRPWYELIDSGRSIAWADPYRFDSSNELGITLAGTARDDAGNFDLVVGVDVRLTELGRFLDARRPGANGVSTVVTSAGLAVASSSPLATTTRFSGPMPVGEETILFNDSDEQTTSAAAHVGATDSFVLLTTASNDDFLGGLRSQFRRDAMIVVAIAAVSVCLFLLAAAWIGRYIHRLNRLATSDPLTGLLNRAAMKRLIDQEIENGEPVAIMILDLDEFKAVNDTHGHAVGDRLLIKVANRLREAAGDDAIVARLGGDEFIALAANVRGRTEHPLWTSMIAAVADTYFVDGIELLVPASGGVTYAVDPIDTSAVLHEADIALYEAKDRGGANYVIFDGRDDGVGTKHIRSRGGNNTNGDSGCGRAVTVHAVTVHAGTVDAPLAIQITDGSRDSDPPGGATAIVASATRTESLRPFSQSEVP